MKRTMNCQRTQSLLSEYVNNTLAGYDAIGVQEHLDACNECARVYHELRRTVDLLSQAPRYDVPDTFGAELWDRLQKVRPRRSLWARLGAVATAVWYIPRWSLGLAGAVLCILVACYVGIPSADHSGPSPDSGVEAAMVRDAFRQNVAISAADPFGDLAAANLTAHASNSESDARPSVE